VQKLVDVDKFSLSLQLLKSSKQFKSLYVWSCLIQHLTYLCEFGVKGTCIIVIATYWVGGRI